MAKYHHIEQLTALNDHYGVWEDHVLHRLKQEGDSFERYKEQLLSFHRRWFKIVTHHDSIANLEDHTDNWPKELVDFFINKRISSTTLFTLLSIYRKSIQALIEIKVEKATLTVQDAFTLITELTTRTESLIEKVSQQYISFQVHALELTRKEMHALSIPLVPVWKDIAVLPIIGDLDDERSQYLQSQTLERATELNLSYIVIDLSGISSINTWFAQHLSNLIQSLRLLGITVILSGMRPELSQTIVRLGIHFRETLTYLTLEQALTSLEFNAANE